MIFTVLETLVKVAASVLVSVMGVLAIRIMVKNSISEMKGESTIEF